MDEDTMPIWRRLTPTQRRAVVEATWERTLISYETWVGGYCFCPLGLALPGENHPDADQVVAALADTIDVFALDMRANGNQAAYMALYEAEEEQIRREADAFITAWDAGRISPDELRATLRELGTSAVTVTP